MVDKHPHDGLVTLTLVVVRAVDDPFVAVPESLVGARVWRDSRKSLANLLVDLRLQPIDLLGRHRKLRHDQNRAVLLTVVVATEPEELGVVAPHGPVGRLGIGSRAVLQHEALLSVAERLQEGAIDHLLTVGQAVVPESRVPLRRHRRRGHRRFWLVGKHVCQGVGAARELPCGQDVAHPEDGHVKASIKKEARADGHETGRQQDGGTAT